MEKKYQIIYIWSFLIISGLILLLLYTPLGGDLHNAAFSEENRYYIVPGVNYQTQVGGFSNGNGGGSTVNSGAPSAYMSESFKSSGAIASGGSFNNSSTSFSGGSNSVGINIAKGNNKSSSGGSGGGGGIGGGLLAVGSSSGNSGGGSFGGGMGGSLLSGSSTTSVMQKASTAEDDPGDPGGDPVTPPLPLGNDFIILLSLAILFGIYKRFKK